MIPDVILIIDEFDFSCGIINSLVKILFSFVFSNLLVEFIVELGEVVDILLIVLGDFDFFLERIRSQLVDILLF
jgi:hypothetical protein